MIFISPRAEPPRKNIHEVAQKNTERKKKSSRHFVTFVDDFNFTPRRAPTEKHPRSHTKKTERKKKSSRHFVTFVDDFHFTPRRAPTEKHPRSRTKKHGEKEKIFAPLRDLRG